MQYKHIECKQCGLKVADNWYIRHVKSGCKIGISGIGLCCDCHSRPATFEGRCDDCNEMEMAVEEYEQLHYERWLNGEE